VSYSRLLLTALTEHKPIDSERVITGDQSWFFRYYHRDSARGALHDDLLYRIKQSGTEKYLISILSSVNGVRSLLRVPNGTMHNITFLTDVVILSLVGSITSGNGKKTLKRWIIQMDSTHPHNSR
jgi:hypothetical protein